MNVVLLCGGKGERLKPLTLEIPKPMVQVKGKPILWYILRQLEKLEVKKLFVAVGYKANVIRDYLTDNYTGRKINIIDNGDADIIERIKSVIKLAPDDDLMILYGDTISDIDFNKLLEFSNEKKKPGTLTVWPLATNFGIVELNNDMEIIEFKEKPNLDKWINIGYFIMRPELFPHLSKFLKYEDFLQFCGSNNLLNAFRHEGEHFTINTLVELEIVEQNIDKIFEF